MARPKRYASEAERMAAKVEARRAKRRDAKTIDAKTIDAKTIDAKTPDNVTDDVSFNPDVPVNPDAPKTDAPVEQWRLDAQHYLRTGELPTPPKRSPGFVAFKDCPHVPHDPRAAPWLGSGRGVVREYKGKAYVLVARHRGNVEPDALEHGVVTARDFAARLNQWCEHGQGWQCHAC